MALYVTVEHVACGCINLCLVTPNRDPESAPDFPFEQAHTQQYSAASQWIPN